MKISGQKNMYFFLPLCAHHQSFFDIGSKALSSSQAFPKYFENGISKCFKWD